MVDAVEAAEAAQDTLDTADAGDVQQSEPVEDVARRLGWRPKEEFKGPADKWIEADAFVERGEQILPIVQANNKALEKTVKAQQAEIDGMKKTFAEFKQFSDKAEERAYKAAVKDIEARLEVAVEAGDQASAKAITKEATELAAEMKAPKTEAKPTATFDAWKGENDWFNVDEDLTAYALGLRFPDGTPEDEQFRIVAAKVRKTFPDKFKTENPRRAAAPAVEGAPHGRRSATKGWADLPPEAKAMADRFIKQGFVKDRDAYVKSYDWS